MDVLTRVKELLKGKNSQKRKSSLTEEFDLDRNKKSRMSNFNGNFDLEPHIVNSGLEYDSTASLRNHIRRSESFVNSSKSDFTTSGTYNQTNERNENHRNFNFNGIDTRRNEFKEPMPPPSTNGARKVPALISATKQAFGHSIFHRNSNQPQQTVQSHFTKFGQPSELSNFKSLPELYPIKANRTNSNVLYSSRDNLVNGHESSLFAHSRFNSMNQYSAFGAGNTLSTSSLLGDGHSFLNSTRDGHLFNRASNTMNSRNNSAFSGSGQMDPPKNLSRTRYQSMLDMIPGFKLLSKSKKPTFNERSVQSIIDLSGESNNTASTSSPVPSIERVNSLKARLETKDVFKNDWQHRINEKYSEKQLSRRDSLRQVEEEKKECARVTRDTEDRLKESLNKITISSIVPEDEEEEEPANDYPPLDNDKQRRIVQWISGRDSGKVLISKFNLSITRHDIQTLQWSPLTWLNDEVINFYMELLAERSRTNTNLPKVHGMNTFFLKRLMENGYSGVRRWTRKVDIFAHDIIPVPVHKGIHWCMAIIHLKDKTIKYCDSLGAPNNPALGALAEYLKAESIDKKKVEFDMSD